MDITLSEVMNRIFLPPFPSLRVWTNAAHTTPLTSSVIDGFFWYCVLAGLLFWLFSKIYKLLRW